MDSDRLLDDKTILDELADVLAGVGIGNLVDLVGIQPHLKMHEGHIGSLHSICTRLLKKYLVLATFHDASGKALLQPQGTHRGNRRLL